MRRCVYCLEPLELVRVAMEVMACMECGLRYAQELLDSIDGERWEEMLTSPRYEVKRIPGEPPAVVITDLSPV